MAAKKVPTKKSAASALIAKALTNREVRLPAEVLAEIETILHHNDAAPRHQRVSMDAVLEMLRELGHPMGHQRFDRVVVAEFGRKWGAK